MVANNLRKIDLNLLRVFDAIYAERHVTRAASRLLTSQSAVSHSLRNLRDIFQDPLFTRTPDGMSPTALADILAERIGDILAQMQDVLAFRNSFVPESASGKLTIGFLSPGPSWLMAGICRRIGAQAPRLDLVFRHIPVQQVAESLDGRAVQLLIGPPDVIADRRRLCHETLFREKHGCLVGVDNPRVGATLDLEDYAGLAHAVIATHHFERTWIDDLLARAGLQRTIKAVVPHPSFIGDLLSSTDMICTLLPSLILPDDRLRLLPVPFPATPMTVSQFYHERDAGNPQIQWLRQVVADVCGHRAAAAPGSASPEVETLPLG